MPYLGVDKGKIWFEIGKILSDSGIDFEVDKDSPAFEGPWTWDMPAYSKVVLGMPGSLLQMNRIEKYATEVTREFVPVVESELKKDGMFGCMLKNVSVDKIPSC